MEAPTLGSIFTRHLGFPAHPSGAVTAEAFADRLADRSHAFVSESADPQAWVEHFFEVEHPFEERETELKALGAAERAPAVLQLELSEREYLVIENDEEVLVVSERGSLVLARTTELSARLKAAELPASTGSPSAAFQGPGDRAYFVGQSGKVALLDARLVAKALEQAPVTREEPLARVTRASRLAAFEPAVRPAPLPKGTFATEPLRQVARAETKGAAPQVVVVERGQATAASGETARFWGRLTTALTAGGRVRENLARTLPGASAIALGRQTYAVKAGGVTALVQRPAPGLGFRGEAFARRTAAFERKAASGAPRWARDLVDERPRDRGFWVTPPVGPGPAGSRPDWVERVLSQARQWRERARDEVRGHLDPPRPTVQVSRRDPAGSLTTGAAERRVPWFEGRAPSATLVGSTPAGTTSLGAFSFGASSFGASSFGASSFGTDLSGGLRPLQLSQAGFDATLPEIRVHSTSAAVEDGARRPFIVADAMPASTLQALYTGLERTAAAQGHRLTSLDLSFGPPNRLASAPPGETEAFVESRFGPPVLTDVAVGTARLPPAYLTAPFAAGGVRVGADLSDALDRSVQRTLVARTSDGVADVAGPEGFASTSRVSSVPPAMGATAVTLPAAISSAMSASGASGRLSALAWLDWALTNAPFAHARASGAPIGTPAGATFVRPARTSEAQPLGGHPAHLLVQHGVPSASSRPAAIGEQRPLPDSVQAHLARGAEPESSGAASLAARAFTGGNALAFAHPEASAEGPSAGAFTVHEASHVFQQDAGRRLTPDVVPLFAATGPTIGTSAPLATRTDGRDGLTAILPLMYVNALREPEGPPPTAGSAEVEPAGTERIEIGLPLHVQMTDARVARERSHALAEQAPATVAVVPVLSSSHASADGMASAALSPSRRSAATSLTPPRPSASIAGGPAAPVGSGASRSGGAVFATPATPASSSSTPSARALESLPRRPARAAGASSSVGSDRQLSDLERPGAMLSAPVHRKARGESLESRAPEMPVVRAPAPEAEAASSPLTPRANVPERGPARATSALAAEPQSSPPTAFAPPRGSAAGASGGQGEPAAAPVAAPRPSAMFEVVAPVRRLARAGGILRFSYPAGPRWWAMGAATPAGQGSAAALPVAGSAPTLVTKRADLPLSASVPELGPTFTALLVPSTVGEAAASGAKPGMASPAAFGARGARVNGLSAASSGASGSASSGAAAALGPSSAALPLELTAPSESELAFVAVAPTGEAKLMTRSAAAQLATRRQAGSVEMTVVAGIAPQAPSLEEMAAAGHERPHAKGKNAGGARSAHGKSDALSLQGTVDSLAQRIYHRLKRRLQSDRERFGG